MNNRKKISSILLLVVLLVCVIIRTIFIIATDWYTAEMDVQLSKISDVNYYIENFSIYNFYMIILSSILFIFGKKVFVVVVVNCLIQFISILLIFLIFKIMSNEFFAFFLTLFFSAWPWYIKKIFDISDFCFSYLVKVLIIGIIAFIYLCICHKLAANKKTEGTEEMKEISFEEINQNIEVGNNDIGVTKELTPPGMTEIKLDNEGNKKKEVIFIKNPLPVPKRKAHKKMDFIVELDSSNNDFDITDMSGMDYFDID